MASFAASIGTDETGPLQLSFVMSEARAQDIFAMLLETAAPIERTLDDGTVYEDRRKLGECLRDEVTTFIHSIEARAIEHKRRKAAEEAAAAVTDAPEAMPLPIEE